MATLRTDPDATLGHHLLTLKAELERKRTRKAQLQGELKAALDQLQQTIGTTSLEQAQQFLAQEEQSLLELQQTIEQALAELDEQLRRMEQ